jgi:hypothetical protein
MTLLLWRNSIAHCRFWRYGVTRCRCEGSQGSLSQIVVLTHNIIRCRFEGTVSHDFVLKGQYQKLSFWRDSITCCRLERDSITYCRFERPVTHVFVWRDSIASCRFEEIVSQVLVVKRQYHTLSFWWDSIKRCRFEVIVSRCGYERTVSHAVVLQGEIHKKIQWRFPFLLLNKIP